MYQQMTSELDKATSNGVNKILFIPAFIFLFSLTSPTISFAQGMPAPYFGESNSAGMGSITGTNNTAPQNDDGHTAREEAEGKSIWEKLQTKELTCKDLSDDNFGTLGEYFMGQMIGESHAAMNAMMIRMMGESGEEQMHVAMGKRLSGCDTTAQYPDMASNMPMMQVMMGGYPFLKGGDDMMGNFATYGPGSFFGFFGMLVMLIFWILIIVAVIALIRWLIQGQGGAHGNRGLDILKERYAKGEINKEEFESKKRDLS